MGCHSSKLNKQQINKLKKLRKDGTLKKGCESQPQSYVNTPMTAKPLQLKNELQQLEFLSLDYDKKQQDQLNMLSKIIPMYKITEDFVYTRKQIRTNEQEPVPIINDSLDQTFIMIKRQLHKKLQQQKTKQISSGQINKQTSKFQIDERIKKIYELM